MLMAFILELLQVAAMQVFLKLTTKTAAEHMVPKNNILINFYIFGFFFSPLHFKPANIENITCFKVPLGGFSKFIYLGKKIKKKNCLNSKYLL